MDFIVLTLVFFMLIGLLVIIRRFLIEIEKESFNKGKCPKCGKELKLFDCSNGRNYVCECGYTALVLHKSVDKNYRRKER